MVLFQKFVFEIQEIRLSQICGIYSAKNSSLDVIA